MLGLELADDVTAKRRRSSRLPASSVPSVRSENPALAVGRLLLHPNPGPIALRGPVLEGSILKRRPTQGDIRLASINFRLRQL